MSFKSVKKFALNKEKPIRFRNQALRSLIIKCLRFGGLEFRKTFNYYQENFNFHNTFLNENDFKTILDELTELREKSLTIEREYQKYRKEQKLLGFKQLSKKEIEYRDNVLQEISSIWDKFK